MEHSDLYDFDILGRLDQAGIKYLLDLVYSSDRQTQKYYSDDSEEQKLTRNALRVGDIGILDGLWRRRYNESGFPWSDYNLQFALQHSDFRTIVRVFEEWTFGHEERDEQLTSQEMIELAKKNIKCGDRIIKFIKEVEDVIGDIYIWNTEVPEEDFLYSDFYEEKCDKLKVYLKDVDRN